MKTMGISTDPTLLSVDLQSTTLAQSPSVSTFLPEEDASICPLLSTNGTPSPPPLMMAFSHPLTPSIGNDSNDSVDNCCEDTRAETSSSSGSSSGIGIVVTETATSTLLNKNAYQNLGKNIDCNFEENGQKSNGILNVLMDKDTPRFVSWNWPLIRKCTFFVFMSSLLAMCAIVMAMIITLPKKCNPRSAWYKGSVLYEIFPASFQDSNNDGLGDIRGIVNRLDYLQSLGLGGIRLNSIFPSKHYPDHFQSITSLKDVDEILGNVNDVQQLAMALHTRNMSIILDLPLHPYLEELDVANSINASTAKENITLTATMQSVPVENVNVVTEAMRFWLSKGIDGFYVKGLEFFANDPNLLDNIAEWKYILGYDRILIVNYDFVEKLTIQKNIEKILHHIDLVDVHLNISSDTQDMRKRIHSIIDGVLKPNSEKGPWIQWSLGGVHKQRISYELNSSNATLAATLLQLMLPGTPSIFYGDEISLQQSEDPLNEHTETKHLHHLSTMIWNGTTQFTNRETLPWIPRGASVAFHNFDEVVRMIALREQAPSMYLNSFSRDGISIQNTNIRYSENHLFIIERYYPRRNTFISISNFGQEPITMDFTSMFYSGRVMVGKTKDTKIYFKEFHIDSMETIVVKLDK